MHCEAGMNHTRRSVWLDIKPRHALRAASLPLDHRDPLDRVIVAQCLTDNHHLVSADSLISGLGIGRIW